MKQLMLSIRRSLLEDRFPQFVLQFMSDQFPQHDYPGWARDALEAAGIPLPAAEKPLTASVAAQTTEKLAESQSETSNPAPAIFDLAGACSLRETAALIEQMNVFICPDTGTGHLAAALGVPVVDIFPLRSDFPARWRPAGANHRIIRPTAWECGGPCVKETCPRFTCLLHIDPQEVVKAVIDLS